VRSTGRDARLGIPRSGGLYHGGVGTSLLEKLRDGAGRAFEGRPVRFAYLFGSQVNGRARPDSDVDVAVQLGDDVPVERYVDLQLELARRLADASSVGGVEVVVFNDAPLTLRGRIVASREVIYSVDEPARVAMESRIAREFGDFEICFRGLDRELLNQIAAGLR
jgi:predicted nucleotidyltransferase